LRDTSTANYLKGCDGFTSREVARSRNKLNSSNEEPGPEDERASIPMGGDSSIKGGARSNSSAWAVALGALCVLLALVVGLVVLRYAVAENIPPLTDVALEAAREKWSASGPASYDLDIKIGGRQPGVVHIEVRDGTVTKADRDGRPTPERTWDEWSVPGQFDTLDRELEMAADPQGTISAPPGAKVWVRCEFDPKFGYSRKFHRYATGGAIETWWEATSFVAR
jgi:hypothetical protein